MISPRLLRSEVRQYALEIMRADGDVGVVDEEEFVVRVRRELHQCTYLPIGAEARRTLDQANRAIGKFALQFVDRVNRGIVERRDPKEQLEFSVVVLATMRAKGV